MSFPTASIPAAVGQSAEMAPIDVALAMINSNPYFIGSMMLMLNFGGRFLALEMSKGQEQFFQSPWVRRSLIFTVIFVGTRNILVAFWMSLFIILCVGYLFNENSSLCLFQLGEKGSSCAADPAGSPSAPGMAAAPGLTQEETMILKQLSDKQQRLISTQQPTSQKAKQNPSEVYWQNMMFMNKEGFNPRF